MTYDANLGADVLADRPVVPVDVRPTVVAPGQDKTSLKLPAGAAVISRNSQIAIAADDDLKFEAGSRLVNMQIGQGGNPVPPEPVVYAARPAPSDPKLGGACITDPQLSRQPVILGSQAPATAAVKEEPRFARVMPTEVKVSPGQVVAPQPIGVSSVIPAVAKKTTVCMMSPAMGKVRAKVDHVGISDNMIMLAYRDDDNTTVVEPPVCDAQNPMFVEIGDKRYRCAYYGLSVTMLDYLWVVLVRADE